MFLHVSTKLWHPTLTTLTSMCCCPPLYFQGVRTVLKILLTQNKRTTLGQLHPHSNPGIAVVRTTEKAAKIC